MNVYGYIRVSTDGQCSDDKFGLEVQREQITTYCSKNGHTIINWVTDEGESGAKERPGFDSIIYGEVDNPPCEAVVVAKSDRVARDINIYYYYKMMLKKKNIQLISIAEDFGQFGVFASMLEAFTLCVAEMERENIMKRTSGGRKAKAKQGGYAGGRPPYGYEPHDGKLVVVPDEATVVKYIFSRRDAGAVMPQICDELNARGIRTRSGSIFRPSSVLCILRNRELYSGLYNYGNDHSDWVMGQHDAILK